MNNDIFCGDALTELQKLESDSIDLIATDPPYGYSFMSKDWDKAVIGVDIWKECLRVLKAGAFAFIMSSPRQDVLAKMILNLIDAGFETNFTSIYWTYASGFPKAADMSKLVDKRFNAKRDIIGQSNGHVKTNSGVFDDDNYDWKTKYDITKPATEQAKALEGAYCGFQPKPAVEVVLVVMKPLSEKTYVDQALTNGHGITWLDDCRIPYQDDNDLEETKRFLNGGNNGLLNYRKISEKHGYDNLKKIPVAAPPPNQKGRFPANLLVSDDVLNDGKITKSDGGTRFKKFGYRHYCEDAGYDHITAQGRDKALTTNQPKDSGSFSRYFDLDRWYETTFPFLIVPKPSKREKNAGLNSYITVKLHHKQIQCSNKEDLTEVVQLLQKVTSGLTNSLSIEESGEGILAQFPTDSSSIISTEINKIIASKIFNSSMHSCISDFIQDANSSMANGGNHAASADNSEKSNQIITSDMMAYPLGVRNAALRTLQQIKEKGNWHGSTVTDGRNKPLDNPFQRGKTIRANTHSTVKPIKLMSYLIMLGSRQNDIILDPFCGSGTTCIAAKMLKRRYLGIELNQEYVNIANARLAAFEDDQPTLFEMVA